MKALATTDGAYLGGHVTGRGKTLIATEVALRSWAGRVLIVAPPGTYGELDNENGIYDGWLGTVYRQTEGAATLQKCSNSKKSEKESLAALMAGDAGWFFLSREMFQQLDWELTPELDKNKQPVIVEATGKPKKKAHQLKAWRKHPFDVAIYDEIQFCANKKSRSFKTWRDLKATMKVGLSADWFGAQLTGMWAVGYSLFPTLVTPNFVAWCDQYLTSEYDHFAFNKKKYTSEKVPGQFVADLGAYGRLESTLGLPPVPENRWVDLLPAQRRMYDEAVRDMLIWVEENPLTIEMPLTLRQRLKEVSLCEFSIEGEDVDFKVGGKSSKADEVKELFASKPDEKFVVFTASKKFAKNLTARFKNAASYTGDDSEKVRAQMKHDFVHSDLKYLVCTIQAAGVGLDGLQVSCNNVIIASEVEGMDYLTEQAIGRVWRQGQTEPVSVYRVLARDTYDAGILDKQIVQGLQNNAAKRVAEMGG